MCITSAILTMEAPETGTMTTRRVSTFRVPMIIDDAALEERRRATALVRPEPRLLGR